MFLQENVTKEKGEEWSLKKVVLHGILPPIDKMDNTLNMLGECE